MEVKPDFSVVIVSYNVSAYLQLCLHSVFNAAGNTPIEVWVVDNASTDDSVAMVKKCFPEVKLIENTENVGFSKANNQALTRATGQYLLLLNPDTIVPESVFESCKNILDRHPEIGGAGIRMLDGQGVFLPESKRGMPTPLVSFFKISGLYRLFPRSRFFNAYYLGHTSPTENQYIEILAGAFLIVRKEVAEKIGYMPEDYFMYGEDIDFSYQITRSGYKNYYIADEKIIHFKGESTKKGSLNYVYIFYKAMAIFSAKYFGKGNAFFYNILISFGILLTATGAAAKRIIQTIGLPVIEIAAFYGFFWYIHDYWEKNHRFISGGEYPAEYVYGILPLYALVLMISIYINGGYKKTQKLADSIKGIGLGFLFIVVFYGLSPEHWRFSRAIMVLGVLSAMVWMVLFRYLLKILNIIQPSASAVGQTAWVITDMRRSSGMKSPQFANQVIFEREILDSSPEDFSINLNATRPHYLIFDSDNMPFADIIKYVEILKPIHTKILYKIPSEHVFVGSNEVIDPAYRNKPNILPSIPFSKRISDLFLLIFYIHLFMPKFLKIYQIRLWDAVKILSGKSTLIGYSTITKSLIDLQEFTAHFSDDLKQMMMHKYYEDISISKDIHLLRMLYKNLSK